MEISLSIDENGRTIAPDISNQVSLDYSTRTLSLELDDSIVPNLVHDCEKTLTEPSLPWTFWMPCNRQPRFALEKLAWTIFHRHIPQGYLYDTSTSGAEWWVQMRPTPTSARRQPGDDTGAISFHWDKDEDLRVASGGLFIHPHLSTVTYLSSMGAPTMILNSKVANIQTGEPNFEPHIDEAFVSWPTVKKHLVFDGALLHGVPSELIPCSQVHRQMHGHNNHDFRGRVTFLVNIWLNYRPLTIQPFPETLLTTTHWVKSQLLDNISLKPSIVETDRITYSHDKDIQGDELFEWTLGGPVVIQAHLPTHTIQDHMRGGGNVNIRWKHCFAIHINVKENN